MCLIDKKQLNAFKLSKNISKVWVFIKNYPHRIVVTCRMPLINYEIYEPILSKLARIVIVDTSERVATYLKI